MIRMTNIPRTFKLNFIGDVMLGRLVDQLFPTHVHEPSEASHIASFVRWNPDLKNYNFQSPWDTTRPLFLSSDLNFMNLETSATTTSNKWPDKVFNYRMHPDNINALKEAKIDYASCANNHTLDFCEEGLFDTVKALKRAGIAFAGAGETREEATRPAILKLPRQSNDSTENSNEAESSFTIHVYAASDHPQDWRSIPSFHLIDYSQATRARLKALLTTTAPSPALKVFSVHWGPNYAWRPAAEIRALAHFLVDECGVDVVHGHSSHHVQGVEVYGAAVIIYGCGDFVDDYAVDGEFRNDLSAVWRVSVAEEGQKLRPSGLEVFPTAIRRFQAKRLDTADVDHAWVVGKIKELSGHFGTKFEEKLGGEGQVVLNIS